MSDLIDNITKDLQKQIDDYKPAVEVSEVGTVIEAGDEFRELSVNRLWAPPAAGGGRGGFGGYAIRHEAVGW